MNESWLKRRDAFERINCKRNKSSVGMIQLLLILSDLRTVFHYLELTILLQPYSSVYIDTLSVIFVEQYVFGNNPQY